MKIYNDPFCWNAEKIGYFLFAKTMNTLFDQAFPFVNERADQFLKACRPGMSGNIDYSLEIPFEMLQAFNVSEYEAFVVVDRIVIMHHSCRRRKGRKDVIVKDTVKIFLQMCTVKGNGLIAIEAETSSGSIDKYDCIIPVEQGGSNAGGINFSNKVIQHFRIPFLKLCKISFTDCKRDR